MKPIEIYAIILVIVVIASVVIGCYLVNRKEKREQQDQTNKSPRQWN